MLSFWSKLRVPPLAVCTTILVTSSTSMSVMLWAAYSCFAVLQMPLRAELSSVYTGPSALRRAYQLFVMEFLLPTVSVHSVSAVFRLSS